MRLGGGGGGKGGGGKGGEGRGGEGRGGGKPSYINPLDLDVCPLLVPQAPIH